MRVRREIYIVPNVTTMRGNVINLYKYRVFYMDLKLCFDSRQIWLKKYVKSYVFVDT